MHAAFAPAAHAPSDSTKALTDTRSSRLFTQVNRLPVVNAAGALVGVLTRTDVVAALAGGASSSQPV